MRSLFHPKAQPLPLAASLLALGAFYWGLFRLQLPDANSVALTPEKSQELQDESAVMRRFGKWNRALAPTLRLHAAYPENHIYIGQLAEIYDHMGRYADESAMWEAYVEHAPRPIEACPQIGQAYEKQGKETRAIAAFEKCLTFEANNPDSLFYLARALERSGQTDRAASLYQLGVAASPGYSDLETGLARMRLRQGKPEEARDLAAAVVRQSPNNTDALLVLGLACQRLGDRTGARNYLERGVKLADTYVDFHLALANMAEQDANLDSAIEHYQRVADLDKTNTEAARRLALLRRAR